MSSWNLHRITHKPRIFLPGSPTPVTISNPTFHILIATDGRPSLKNMLDSLKPELNSSDAITIVFDGEDALKKSEFKNEWLEGHKSKINIIEQIPNLGFWGHGIRNKYQGILEPKTTFIMNADDDDVYIGGSFGELRNACTSPNILYIAKLYVAKSNKILPPSNSNVIAKSQIGTPSGIIPFDIAAKSTWKNEYGGDFNYYNALQHVAPIKFLDNVIYKIL